MASLTMMASFSAVAAAAAPPARRGGFAAARAAKVERCQEPARLQAAEEAEARPADGRRAVMLAAAAAAVAAFGGAGVASAEPRKGTPEAKKKYATICVTMPTAKICHN
ncbi:photosystem II 5 kDa protein, chloroplastic-like [Phragmites australis]|uniref:photosystem II 5 kDa protein, chloroplastic-like n=1 Tax=Phragmites australis TaxID=29695 RepID=UPI002D770B7B|nr:photosystem II 5 kDa protein, chloroplastic-like [Phragmites australis]